MSETVTTFTDETTKVTTFVLTREDGHTLSYSSMTNTLVHFNHNYVVKDFGLVRSAQRYLAIATAFMAGMKVS